MTSRKNTIEYTALGLLVLSIVGVLYFFEFKPNASKVPPPPLGNPGQPGVSAFQTPGTASLSSAGATSPDQVLPYGDKLDPNNILKNPIFQDMENYPPVYPKVDASMLGVASPFASAPAPNPAPTQKAH